MNRTFTAKPAAREPIPLMVGIVGPSSSGKTYSALRLATGIQRVCGGDIHLIDSENKRALAYSEMFSFKHVVFEPPFGSLDYMAALEQSVAAGARTIIVDSASHEHESTGGLIDAHEAELDRMAGDDWKKRERVAMLAWQKPKAARRKLLQGITRLNANVILLFRAKTTSKPIKNKEGKTEIVPMGFMPIAGDEFVYEMALSCLLLPGSDGVPTWNPENPGERMAVKLPIQFRSLIRPGEPLSEELGERLAQWAAGPPRDLPADIAAALESGRAAAVSGMAALRAWWNDSGLTAQQKTALKSYRDGELTNAAKAADSAPQAAAHTEREPA